MRLSKTAMAVGIASALFIAQGSIASDSLQVVGTPQVSGQVNPGAGAKPTADAEGRAVYIVQFTNPPLASYAGGVEGLAGTSAKATGAKRLDTKSAAAKAYVNYLKAEQDEFIARMGAAAKSNDGKSPAVRFTYQHAFNGVAMEMTAAQAQRAASLPGVLRVTQERFYEPETDAGPDWVDAEFIWTGPPNNVPHSFGDGVVVGVLDTGINHDHPSFADVGDDGFDHTNPLGSGNYVPGSFCDVNDPTFCNDKLIGAWSFVPGDPNFPSPEASDGHGVHTAGTAAGNIVADATIVAPTDTFVANVSGVAPHANVIAYDVCIATCPGSALVAAVNQVVIDSGNLPNGIAAINYSISGGSNPYSDPVELGFLAATDAGIFVSTSAGNSGPGAGTVAHLSPWVASVAASTHNREIHNSLVDLDSDGASLPDILGRGLTSGYGPAPIIHAEDFPTSNGSDNDTNPGQCFDPFPAGHFNGEIVICDRGTIARVDKGANVLAGGAGGFVLANTAADGDSIVADAHFLPGVHITFDDAQALDAWRTSNANPVAAISGSSVSLAASNGDIMAAFSSRGPSQAFDVLKPDVSAPGVSIMAGLATDGVTPAPEFGFLSGTSMASPHNAGSAAILKAVKPDWTPHEIKSALMLSSTDSGIRKEDGTTPTDHFDIGAGRINLERAQEVGLVLNETTSNFLAADPNLGGDPTTLNLASMQNGLCIETCSWTRTVRSVNDETTQWTLSTTGPDWLGFELVDSSGHPSHLKLKKGESAEIMVTANTALAPEEWQFARLNLDRQGDGPDLHMPIAVRPATASNEPVFNKNVSQANASAGDVLSYEINVNNGPFTGPITVTDVLPDGLSFVAGSESESVSGGSTTSPWSYDAGTNSLSWTGMLDVSSFGLSASPSPFGFFPLASIGVTPFACPSNCDDGGFILNVPSFVYKGQSYNQVIWSVNGTVEAGTSSGLAAGGSNQELPSPTPPNNLMAPLWADLNLGAGGNWYVASLSSGPNSYLVYEWNDVPLFSDNTRRYSFQIWVQNGASGNIWFTYDQVDTPLPNLTVGVEDDGGIAGASRYFNGTGTAPAVGTDLKVTEVFGGSATLGFDAEATCSSDPIINRANLSSGAQSETAIAVTKCN